MARRLDLGAGRPGRAGTPVGARDGDSAAQRQHVAAWLAEELPFLLRERPWRKASFIVAGTTEMPHDRKSEIVTPPAVSPGSPPGR